MSEISHIAKKADCKRLNTKPKKQEHQASEIKTRPMLDLGRTVVGGLFVSRTRPWDAIAGMSKYITERGIDLPYDEYDEVAANVWVHLTAYLAPDIKIEGPAIICGGARICHHAHIIGSVIGAFASVGDCSTVKNSILFDRSVLSGQNAVYSSVLGYEANLGVGAMIPDSRLDALNITVDMPEGTYITGRSHLGAVVCDGVKAGANCVINPGAVIDSGSIVYPCTSVSGYHYPYSEVK